MELNCTICLDRLKHPLGKPDNCEHKFCLKCISDWFKKRSQCPLCGGTPKYLIKIDETEKETKIPVKKRTAKQFENELLVREQLEEDQSRSIDECEDITVQYASCRLCGRSDNEHLLLLCDGNVGQNADGSMIRCNVAYHSYCLPEKLDQIPRDDWFCPFCAIKPENSQRFAKQINLNISPAENDTSNLLLFKNETNTCTKSNCNSNKSSKQNDVKMETIERNNITKSESTVIRDAACGDSDAESESIKSNYSSENTELCTETEASIDNYDDDYEETDLDRIIESSNDSEDSEAETNTGSCSEILDDDDDTIDYEESDESDSEYKLIRPMFRNRCRRKKGMNRNRRKTIHTAEKVSGFMTKTKSKTRKTMITYQGFVLTHHHHSA